MAPVTTHVLRDAPSASRDAATRADARGIIVVGIAVRGVPSPSRRARMTLDARLDDVERELVRVAKALVRRAIDRDARDDAGDSNDADDVPLDDVVATLRAIDDDLRALRAAILDARSSAFADGARARAALLTRHGEATARARALEEDARRDARGERTTSAVPSARSAGATTTTTTTTTTVWETMGRALRGLVRGAGDAGVADDASGTRGARRFTREQREREKMSGVTTTRVGATRWDDGEAEGDGAARGTWFAGAAESLARVGSTATETNANAAPSASASEDVARDELFERRASSEARSAPTAAAGERARRVDAMRGADRLDASSDVLSECADVLAETQDVGASVLETLAAQRESLIRSGAAARGAKKKMDENLKIVKGMNSWTRLGR